MYIHEYKTFIAFLAVNTFVITSAAKQSSASFEVMQKLSFFSSPTIPGLRYLMLRSWIVYFALAFINIWQLIYSGVIRNPLTFEAGQRYLFAFSLVFSNLRQSTALFPMHVFII